MAGLSTKYNYDAYLQHRNEQNQNQQNQGQGVVNIQQPANTGDNPAVATQQPTQVAPSAQQSQNNVGEKSLVMKPTVQDGAPNANATADNAVTTGEMKSKLAIAQHFGRRMPEITAETAPSEAAYTAYEHKINPQPQEENHKHGWRDYFRNTGDEEFENKKRERIAAFSDMIRHLANLYYVNQYATPQHIESAYGKVKAEEKEQRKLKREQDKEDRKWNWKVSEAQRDQYNKDRTYGLGVRKDKREEALQPEKLKKAQEAAAAEEAKKRAEQAKATKLSAEAEYADEIASNKAKEQESKAALAAARVATEKARAAKVAQEGKNAKLRGQELTAKIRSQYSKDHDFFDTNDKRYEWAIPKSQRDLVFNELRSIAHMKGWGKAKGSGGSEYDKYTTKSDDTDRELLREALSKKGDPEVQQFFKRHGVLVESNWESNEAIRKDIKKRDEDKKRTANGGRGIK